MHAFTQKRYFQRAHDDPAQRSGGPQLVVVGATGIEAHDQRQLTDPRRQVFDVCRQIIAARLFAGLDQHDRARVRLLVSAQRRQRRQRSEDRVTVIGSATPIQLVALEHGLPGAEPLTPAGHFRLFVEMPVEQHAVARSAASARYVDEDHWRAFAELHDLERGTLRERLARPARQERNSAIHVPRLLPLRVERRALVRDRDVTHQRGQDRIREAFFDPLRALVTDWHPRSVSPYCGGCADGRRAP